MDTAGPISRERRGHIFLIGLNRPAKRNAFDLAMLNELALAYGEMQRDEEVRCGVLFAHGDHFTAGLDLAQVAPSRASSRSRRAASTHGDCATPSGRSRWYAPCRASA